MSESEKSLSAPEIQFGGSCVCRRLTYSCTSLPIDGSTTACHCVTCRKLSSGPYQAFAHVKSEKILYFDNQEHLRYEGLPKDNIGGIVYLRFSRVGERAFCGSCHTPLAMRYRHQPKEVGITLGTIDEESIASSRVKELLQIDQHIFTSQKVFWIDVGKDGVPKYERFTSTFEDDMAAWENHELQRNSYMRGPIGSGDLGSGKHSFLSTVLLILDPLLYDVKIWVRSSQKLVDPMLHASGQCQSGPINALDAVMIEGMEGM